MWIVNFIEKQVQKIRWSWKFGENWKIKPKIQNIKILSLKFEHKLIIKILKFQPSFVRSYLLNFIYHHRTKSKVSSMKSQLLFNLSTITFKDSLYDTTSNVVKTLMKFSGFKYSTTWRNHHQYIVDTQVLKKCRRIFIEI